MLMRPPTQVQQYCVQCDHDVTQAVAYLRTA